MKLALTVGHRLLGGVQAAQSLLALRELIEKSILTLQREDD